MSTQLTALPPIWGALFGAVVAAALAWATWLAVARLPEPEVGPDEPSPDYDLLPTTAAVAGTVLVAAVAGGALGWFSSGMTGALVVWASAALVLVWVDLRTTYLPSAIQWPITAALAVCLVLGQLRDPDPSMLVRALLGAALSGALFWLIWRLGLGLGFGDVRLALAMGMITAAGSWAWWWAALIAGTAVGAVWGVIWGLVMRRRPTPSPTAAPRHAAPEELEPAASGRHRGGRPAQAGGQGFPYGPALWAGVWLGMWFASGPFG